MWLLFLLGPFALMFLSLLLLGLFTLMIVLIAGPVCSHVSLVRTRDEREIERREREGETQRKKERERETER